MIHEMVQTDLAQLLSYVESEDYAGYDPYDALNSRLIRWLGAPSKWIRIAATQFLRRCPVNLRPLLGIQKGHNPKAIGLFLSGYSRLYSIESDADYLRGIDRLLDLLDELRSMGYSGNCWGYNFPWQSRTYYRPRWTPTTVNTAFIGHALLDCYELTHKARALDMALPIKEFLLRDVNRTASSDTFCFSYTPLDKAVVHNANLLAASILIRLRKHSADPSLEGASLASLAFSMRRQQENGSWLYGEAPAQGWIDSFHTGFNLQAIRHFLCEGYARDYAPQYRRGVSFYADNFFRGDGTPKYYHDRVYPIDIHSAAQAIFFFSGEGTPYKRLAATTLSWTRAKMLSKEGFFYFRKGRFLRNRIPYMRWAQAWMFHALTEYWVRSRNGSSQ